jgi:hypothetical protein
MPVARGDVEDPGRHRDRATARHDLVDRLQHAEAVARARLALHPEATPGKPDRHPVRLAGGGGVEPVGQPERLRLGVGQGLPPQGHHLQGPRAQVGDVVEHGMVGAPAPSAAGVHGLDVNLGGTRSAVHGT